MSRAQKERCREHAYRVRGAIADVERAAAITATADIILRNWSGDRYDRWLEALERLWHYGSLRINRWISRLACRVVAGPEPLFVSGGERRVLAPP